MTPGTSRLLEVPCSAMLSRDVPDRLASGHHAVGRALEGGVLGVRERERFGVAARRTLLAWSRTALAGWETRDLILAAVVGAMICYMVLATDVMGRLPEYATLKAMGYSNRFLALVEASLGLTEHLPIRVA